MKINVKHLAIVSLLAAVLAAPLANAQSNDTQTPTMGLGDMKGGDMQGMMGMMQMMEQCTKMMQTMNDQPAKPMMPEGEEQKG